jgi:hypothetical protein
LNAIRGDNTLQGNWERLAPNKKVDNLF